MKSIFLLYLPNFAGFTVFFLVVPNFQRLPVKSAGHSSRFIHERVFTEFLPSFT